MTFQKRLKACMRKHGMRTADLARHFGRPYTTVREWVLHGRAPTSSPKGLVRIERDLMKLETKRAG